MKRLFARFTYPGHKIGRLVEKHVATNGPIYIEIYTKKKDGLSRKVRINIEYSDSGIVRILASRFDFQFNVWKELRSIW